MSRFSYTALDRHGQEQSGLLDAADLKRAASLLRGRGLYPVQVQPAEVPPAPAHRVDSETGARSMRRSSWYGRLSLGRPVGAGELPVFTRQLATLLRAGMPLLQSLEVLGRQEWKPGFSGLLGALAEAIRSGGTLSEAMAQHPRVFDRLYVSMIRAGEAGGVLDTVLDRLAGFQAQRRRLRSKLTAAMAYPLIVMTVAGAILAGLLVFVVPRFKQVFADLLKGAPLPPLTRVVLGISEAVQHHFPLVLAVAAILGAGWQLYRRTPAGSRRLDALVIRLPVFGDLLLKGLIARFGRTLGTLLASGVPILPALLITRDTCGNARVAGVITGVHDRVKEGASLARPLESAQVFPPLMTGMIEVGEHTGRLPEMLGQLADIYETEVDHAVAGLSSLIEPVLVLFLAGVVGTIVIALFLPIIRIVQLLT